MGSGARAAGLSSPHPVSATAPASRTRATSILDFIFVTRPRYLPTLLLTSDAHFVRLARSCAALTCWYSGTSADNVRHPALFTPLDVRWARPVRELVTYGAA